MYDDELTAAGGVPAQYTAGGNAATTAGFPGPGYPEAAYPTTTDLSGRTAAAPGGRAYAASNVTRLLCAGTYLDDNYRRAVIHSLLTERFRQIAPSYGYDVVPVLGHALAARTMRLYHTVLVYTGFAVFGILWITHLFSAIDALLLFAWWAWGASYLLRAVSLETLIRDFKPAESEAGQRTRSRSARRPVGGFTGRYPADDRLGPDRVEELTQQQAAHDGVIYYGGFAPFVGAGYPLPSWSNAELLIEAPAHPFLDDAEEAQEPEKAQAAADGLLPTTSSGENEGLITFDVDEITDYVALHLIADLQKNAEPPTNVENLVVERRRYAKAVARRASGQINAYQPVPDIHWEESYDAAREFLCIRVGAWDQEVVTSMFVGFDIKGNTLHTEFYPYVLPPIKDAFHIVDRLPDGFTPRLVGRIAFDALRAAPFETLGTLLHPRAHRLARPGDVIEQLDRQLSKGRGGSGGGSSLGLARYAGMRIDRGADHSVRQLATVNQMHHFFQKSDIAKYTQIVERSLLRIIEDFLREHNVDLADHRATQANILNQSFGDVHNHGDGSVTSQGNTGRQSVRSKFTRTPTTED